jgi:membrane protease YdiL (CAAX protease family)
MSRLREEMKVIPGVAKAIAICCYLAFVALIWLVLIPRDPKLSLWPQWGMGLFAVAIPIPVAIYILLIGYVNSDARRRGMRYVLWTLLAIFIPNAIGIILYFILRDPLLRGCPNCGTAVSQGFAFCSKCGTALAHACPGCRSAVQPEWLHCTKCGARLRDA